MDLKQLNKLTTEELLAQLENEQAPAKSGRYKNEILNFITHFDIQPGTNKIRTTLLYRIYSEWSGEPTKYSVFTSILYLFLPKEKKQGYNYIAITNNFTDLIEIFEELQNKKKRDKSKTLFTTKQIDSFFKTYNIKDGNLYLEGYLLYHLYDNWCYNTKKPKQLTVRNFNKVLSIFFEYKIKNKCPYYKIHKDVLQFLPRQVIIEIRKQKEQGWLYARKLKKAQKQKKQAKIRGNEAGI